MVDKGTFREDLFYRINLIKIHLPSLRERKNDIPLLVDFYVNKKDVYTSIGSVKVHAVELKTYKDKIFEIRVETDMDPKLYQGLVKILGEDGKWSARNKSYYWGSDNLNLQFKKISKKRLQLLY